MLNTKSAVAMCPFSDPCRLFLFLQASKRQRTTDNSNDEETEALRKENENLRNENQELRKEIERLLAK